jgi:uncharacterized damage-inducible protein DinB
MDAAGMRKLFGYNSWANERTLGALSAAPAAAYGADAGSSHGGMHGTMLHVVYAQHLWLLRWTGRPQEEAIAMRKEISTLGALLEYWKKTERETFAFLDSKLSDAFLQGTFTMRTTQGDAYTHNYGESMLHLVIHSGYHRGQVTTLLRQAGQAPPNTDYIMYERQLRAGGSKA